MSKRSKDQSDWRSGSDAFFRAVRSDHDATAADFARVEAQLARRLAAGALDQPTPQGELSAIAPAARAFTLGKAAKLWIGLSVLAAGSYGMLRTFESASSRRSQAAGLPQSAPPPSAAGPSAQAIETPASTEPSSFVRGSVPEPRDRQLPVASVRHEVAARAPLPRTAVRDASAPKRSRVNGKHTVPTRAQASSPAAQGVGAQVSSTANVAAGSGLPTSANVNASAHTDSNTASAPSTGASLPVAPNGKVAANTSATAITQSSAPEASAQATPRVDETSHKKPDGKIAAARATNASAANDPNVRRSSAQQARGAQTRAGKSVDAPDARAELALVERMQAAMRAGEASEALALCAEHSKRWPSGVFVEEREAVRAIASCTLRSDDAAMRAQVFLRKYLRAPTAPRVAAACAPLTAAARNAAPPK